MAKAESKPLLCIALDWNKSEKDYIACDGTDAVECKIEGILHSLKRVPLCRAHMKAFYDMGADVTPQRTPRWMAEVKRSDTQTDFVHRR